MEPFSPPQCQLHAQSQRIMRATAEYIMAEMKRPDFVLLDVRTDEEWAAQTAVATNASATCPAQYTSSG